MEQTPREITLEIIDSATELAGHHYRVYTLGLTGVLAQAMDNPMLGSAGIAMPLIKNSFENSATFLQTTLRNSLTGVLRVALDTLMERAIDQSRMIVMKDTDIYALAEHTQEMGKNVVMRIVNVADNDKTTGRKALRQFMLDVDSRISQGMTKMGAIQTLRAGRAGNVKFTQADRSGKLWHSTNYVTTAVRSALLHGYIEAYLFAVSKRPQDIVKVEHSSGHKNNGLKFSISGLDTGYPSYESIRDQVFHPNSKALVTSD